jgi:hypothetical protein
VVAQFRQARAGDEPDVACPYYAAVHNAPNLLQSGPPRIGKASFSN